MISSPPYFGLRDYGTPARFWGGDPDCAHLGLAIDLRVGTSDGFCKCGAWLGHLGLEPTVELYVDHVVHVFREVRRVLRDDGTLWLVLGDSYYCNPPGNQRPDHSGPKLQGSRGQQGYGRAAADGKRAAHLVMRDGSPRAPETRSSRGGQGRRDLAAAGADSSRRSGRRSGTRAGGQAPKDRSALVPDNGRSQKQLVGAPWRIALALQADGWFLRSEIIWSKPNPMPEAVIDRPTRSHETVFLLAKSRRYHYDHEAVSEPSVESSERRNARTVWHLPTVPYPGAHYAAFPPKLVRTMLLASVPRHACSSCGVPLRTASRRSGWPCECRNPHSVRGVVLDPFAGTGTVGRVAVQLGRRAVLCDLSGKYLAEHARARTSRVQTELLG